MKTSPHRNTSAIVDLKAIRNNIEKFKKHIHPNAEIWPAVKADAYGHGSVEVSKAVSDLVGGFCVSNLDEAIELRNHLVTKPILVLSGIVPEDVDIAAALNISLTAPSLEWLKLVVQEEAELSDLKIHIGVDSGMGRIGIRDVEEANQMIELADKYAINFEGIFTHFATADMADDTKFKDQQARFNKIMAGLSRKPKFVHSTNTAAALWHKEQVQAIERLGISMYGLNPSGKTLELPFEIEPALSLVSELTHIKKIAAGETVGYGATYETSEETWIGTVPIGYADGWTRQMQGFKVLVNGEFCEIVGRVCMDQMMIKLDKSYPIGTKVILIGRDKTNEITTTDVADWRGTINYEVLCLLSDRIKRIYK